MENGILKVENCEYYNSKTKKCRIFRELECGIKLTSFKCEDDHDCYYKRLSKEIEENIKLRKEIEEYNIKYPNLYGMYKRELKKNEEVLSVLNEINDNAQTIINHIKTCNEVIGGCCGEQGC